MQQTWCFDFDSTLFDLLGPWVAAHNRVYEKQMTVEEITDWGMENFADPVCGNKIYDLVTPELYEEVKPFPLALEAVEAVMGRGHTVTFATSVLPATVGGVKLGLLRKYGFLPKGKVARDYYLETIVIIVQGKISVI